ncbi:hypothetical protein HanRHA438_Chr06g0249301 [Helianthus annuus]|nr:hypothetical protein HanRHA438_Chr06g0249301 [Helianthus annuus]
MGDGGGEHMSAVWGGGRGGGEGDEGAEMVGEEGWFFETLSGDYYGDIWVVMTVVGGGSRTVRGE